MLIHCLNYYGSLGIPKEVKIRLLVEEFIRAYIIRYVHISRGKGNILVEERASKSCPRTFAMYLVKEKEESKSKLLVKSREEVAGGCIHRFS